MNEHFYSISTISTSNNPKYCFIFLHGIGMTGDFFKDLFLEQKFFNHLDLEMVCPTAPLTPTPFLFGFPKHSWYEFNSLNLHEEIEELPKAEKTILSLIETQLAKGFTPSHIFLGGFSQGGGLALYTGLRYKQKLGGIIALSSFLPMPETFSKKIDSSISNIPVFLSHGYFDPIVPYFYGIHAKKTLQKQGYSHIYWYENPYFHNLPKELFPILSNWVQQITNNP